jgi:putative transcriptional regulator
MLADVKHTCHVRNTVRALRLERSLSQAELATATGVSRQTINSIETGRYLPSLPLAMALARYFETTVEEVFHDDDD